jgi:hypothetical protein
LLEYTGGNASNFISVKRTDADAFDGTKTHGVTFVGTTYTKVTDRDVVGVFLVPGVTDPNVAARDKFGARKLYETKSGAESKHWCMSNGIQVGFVCLVLAALIILIYFNKAPQPKEFYL